MHSEFMSSSPTRLATALAMPMLVAMLVSSCKAQRTVVFPPTVEYEVSGTAKRVSLTYTNSSEGTEQLRDISLPWTLTLESLRPNAFLHLAAQIEDGSGTVIARILVNGREFKRAASSGFASIASVSGSLPASSFIEMSEEVVADATRLLVARVASSLDEFKKSAKRYPESLEELVKTKKLVQKQTKDPWGRELVFETGERGGRVCSVGSDGWQGTKDDICSDDRPE